MRLRIQNSHVITSKSALIIYNQLLTGNLYCSGGIVLSRYAFCLNSFVVLVVIGSQILYCRFSQFFIAPLAKPETMDREVQAIDSGSHHINLSCIMGFMSF